MASWSEMNGGARAGLVALGVAGIAVVGTLIWRASQPVPVPPETVIAASEPAAATTVPVADPAPTVAPAVAEPIAPSFDNWRVEADGSAVVSGRAEPGSMVTVLVDGRPVAEARASGSGAFALLFTLAANDKPSVMMLEALLPDGRQIFSPQTIALAPIPGVASEDVASAEPAAAPAAVVVTEDTVTVIQPPEEQAIVTDEAAAAPEPVAPTQEVAADTPAPVAVAAVVLDAISYNAAGDVLLSGKGQAGQVARVYLDNVLVQSVEIAPSGVWQVTLADTAPGIYTLRIDQVDAEGKVSARFETPFQRETRERLAALAQGATASVEAEGQSGASAPAPVAESPVAETPAAESPAVAASPTEPSVPAEVVSDSVESPVAAPDQRATDQTESASIAPSDPQTEAAPVVPDAPVATAVTESAPATTGSATTGPATTEPVAPPLASAEPVATGQATTATVATVPEPPAPAAPQAAPAVVAEATAPALQTLDAPAVQPPASVGASVGDEVAPPAGAAPSTLTQPTTDQAPGTVPATVSITVQPGYTLWGIARASLGDGILYVQVYNANKDKIKNPDLIYPGQVFTLPVQE
jgi:nucleoid-associated protein YgaU